MQLSKLANNTDAEPVSFENFGDLARIITTSDWAPGLFNGNYRRLANFKSAQIIALDIDGGCSLEEAKRLFSKYRHVIATTRSHQKEKNGVVCDRFRVVLVLSNEVTSAEAYRSTYFSLALEYPFIDLACADAARMFYRSSEIYSGLEVGETVPVVLRGAVAKTTLDFIQKGAPKGEWNKNLFKAAKDLQQQGYTQQDVEKMLSRPTGFLDNSDLKTIASAFSSDPKYPARVSTQLQPATSIEAWAIEWAELNQVKVTYDERIYYGGYPITFTQLEDRFMLDTYSAARNFPQKLLLPALREWHESQVKAVVDSYKKSIQYQPKSPEIVKNLVIAWEGKENKLTEAVILQFVWSVKRKLMQQPVYHHLMPILVGKSGGGKSEAVKLLLEPISELTTEKRLNVINDNRELFNFTKYYTVFFDEMAYASKTDVDCLKNIISSPTISYRLMGKNKNFVGPNVSTFIGAANKDVKHLINDPTSVRRYYQINCLDKLDWDTINEIDYLSLWKSVDHNADAPIKPFLEELAPIQEMSRSQTLIEEWLELNCNIEQGWTKGDDALRHFMEWTKAHNLRNHYRPKRFLEELGQLVEKKRINNKFHYMFTINNAFSQSLEVVS